MLAYVTADPGHYKPFRVPQDDEHVTRLSAFLTPGEYEAVSFGIYAMADLTGVSVEVRGVDFEVDVRYMHFWPQRTRWFNREFYITPELLLPCGGGKRLVPLTRGVLEERSFVLQKRETGAFWLTLHAPPETKPGRYEATVVVSSRDSRAPLEIPLDVEVLPFELRKPADHHWMLYCDSFRWKSMSREQVLAELNDFARHGITGLIEAPFGDVRLTGEGVADISVDVKPFREFVELCQIAGIPGPHVPASHLGDAPKVVKEALGLKLDLWKDPWPDELKAGVAAMAREVVAATSDIPAKWYFYGVDEPAETNTYAIQEYECWRRGGAETYATIPAPNFLNKAGEYLTATCLMTPKVCTNWKANHSRERCAEAGTEFWWYGTGSYVNPAPQEGSMLPNRYGAGFMFWKTGATGQVSWTFCRPHEDVFNDFDGFPDNDQEPKEQAIVYPHFLKPDDWSTYQGAIPTIAWESLREGVDDYRYAYTLKSLITEAADSDDQAVRETAKRIDASLEALVKSVPWGDPLRISQQPREGLDVKRLQHTRRKVAALTIELLEEMGELPRD
jgi:hypothetical protein